ncbi:MAG: PASTA domain-containing protein, partial [Streptomyces sp.]|nr:PASTA domain-containing protein [Streptomyces sp.]
KIQVPDFTYKNWDSVLSCLKSVGWHYDKTAVDENTWGEGIVIRQSPKAGTDVDPKDVDIQFDISTGNPA